MKSAIASGTLGLAALAILASPFALADDAGWYIGANIGQSKSKIDNARITSQMLGAGLTTSSITDDEHDTGYKLFGGYSFNRYFAVEGGYFDLGTFSFTAVSAVPFSGTLSGNIKLRGLNLDAIGALPITERFSVFGRVGMNYAEARDNFTSTGFVPALANPNPSKREWNPKIGLGVQYDFTESLGMRVEAERYRVNDAVGNKGDIDMVSVGLVYRFGAPTPAPRRAAAPAPEPMVVAPPPPPPPRPVVVAAPPPPPPVPKKVTFSADSLFGFDQAVLLPAGQQDLDKITAALKGARFEAITITGHTDRIGSHAYNLSLSQRRADVVKAYLVNSGMPADMITATGVDGADPVTTPDECKSRMVTAKVIACLQPDRRVEVEIVGTQVSE